MKRTISLTTFLCFLLVILICTTTPSAATGTYQSKIIDLYSGELIAYWPLNETTGTTAEDLSGYDFDGTYHGVTLDNIDGPCSATGRSGLFDGINDYISLPISSIAAALDEDDFTIAVWARPTGTGTRYIAQFTSSSNYITGRIAFISSTYYFDYKPSANLYERTTAGSLDTWVSLIFVISKNTNQMRAYINGVEIGTTISPIDEWTDGNIVSGIIGGLELSDLTRLSYFYGNIAHVMIFNMAASDDDIAIISDCNPLPPTATPTATATSTPTDTPTPTSTVPPTATNTPLPWQIYATLPSGQEYRVDVQTTAGDLGNIVVTLVEIGLLTFIVFLVLMRRRR